MAGGGAVGAAATGACRGAYNRSIVDRRVIWASRRCVKQGQLVAGRWGSR